ncbi:MAG: hypothetical protein LBR26_16780 [Prevotella sp.]|jgi:hypothetical protein|nr:hypothetical protein [Prevotella sp.]
MWLKDDDVTNVRFSIEHLVQKSNNANYSYFNIEKIIRRTNTGGGGGSIPTD